MSIYKSLSYDWSNDQVDQEDERMMSLLPSFSSIYDYQLLRKKKRNEG